MNVIEFGLLDFVAGAFFPSQMSVYNEREPSGRLRDDAPREMHPVYHFEHIHGQRFDDDAFCVRYRRCADDRQ